MRILHVIQKLDIGGAERVTVSLVKGARAAGHDVAVAAAPGQLSRELDVPMFRIPELHRRLAVVPRAVADIRRACATWRPDIVHAHNPAMAMSARIAVRTENTIRMFVTVHGLADRDYWTAAQVIRWLRIPVVSCGVAVADKLAGYELRSEVIENGVPAPPAAISRADLEKRCGVGRRRFVVAAVGRLVPEKNFALAIRAIRDVPNAVLIIIGDGPLRGPLAAEAMKFGVADRVVIAGFRADVRAVMGAVDANVMVSRREGWPLACLEALSSGRPLVAARAAWQSPLLRDGENCLLAAQDDPESLAAALNRVLSDSSLASRLSLAGGEAARPYSEQRMIENYLAFYSRLAANARPSAASRSDASTG